MMAHNSVPSGLGTGVPFLLGKSWVFVFVCLVLVSFGSCEVGGFSGEGIEGEILEGYFGSYFSGGVFSDKNNLIEDDEKMVGYLEELRDGGLNIVFITLEDLRMYPVFADYVFNETETTVLLLTDEENIVAISRNDTYNEVAGVLSEQDIGRSVEDRVLVSLERLVEYERGESFSFVYLFYFSLFFFCIVLFLFKGNGTLGSFFGFFVWSFLLVGVAVPLDLVSAVNNPSFGVQSSSRYIDWDFDFVETFDGLADWDMKVHDRLRNVDDVDLMPKLLDGGDSAWGYFSQWGEDTYPQQNWIDSYGDNRVWRGNKSVCIDIGRTDSGPSRFGVHMGEGYSDFYLFYMVNIPKNEFPTECEGGSCKGGAVGAYVEGEEYRGWASWKFGTFNVDCPTALCPDASYSEYWHMIPHIKMDNYDPVNGLTVRMEGQGEDNDEWADSEEFRLDGYLGDWFGIEWHINQTVNETIIDIWVYDQEGNSVKIMDSYVFQTPAEAQNRNWNQFFFGGNNSGTYLWGPTMKSEYYIDDFIIDDERIGPKYFSLINGTLPELDCVDEDEDGYGVGVDCLGVDCDDNDTSLNLTLSCEFNGTDCGEYGMCVLSCPVLLEEICGDLIDQDCDGEDLECSFHEADSDEDGGVSLGELMDYIELWLSGGKSIGDILGAVGVWKN